VYPNDNPSIDNQPLSDEQPFLPILARIIDLGQGPPGLVSWVRERLGVLRMSAGDPETDCGTPILLRMARELIRLLPPGMRPGIPPEALQQTLWGRGAETLPPK